MGDAKLARIARAEAEYMENHKLKEQEAISEVEKDVGSRLGEGEASVEDANTEVKKKKKRGKDGIDAITNQELPRCDEKGFVNEEEEDQKPKKKKLKKRPVEENIENDKSPHELKVKKKSKKSKDDSDDSPLGVHLIALTEEESATKKKKKSKKKKLKGGSD